MIGPADYDGFVATSYNAQSPTPEDYFAQFDRCAYSSVEFMVRYEAGFIDKSDGKGRDFQAATGLPARTRYLKALSLGVRWDMSPESVLRSECLRNSGTLILGNKENPRPELTEGDWEMFSLSASYRI